MKEIRCVEVRADENPESRIIQGYAIRFNEWSRDLGGFQEIIFPEALNEDTLRNSDVVMNINHDNDKMVARYRQGQGTLELQLDDQGLYFRFDAPTTQLGDELLYNVRNGNLFECSFAFSIADDDKSERWYRDESNSLKREIRHISGLYDCSIVTHAAYPTTSCSTRSEEIHDLSKAVDAAMDLIDKEIDEL